MDIQAFTVNNKPLGTVRVTKQSKIIDLKREIAAKNKLLPIERQSLRLANKGKDLNNDLAVANLELLSGNKIYVKDLGPQISWRFVFLAEYLGPLVVYLLFYFYRQDSISSCVPKIAAVCWSVHYAKRLFETIFIHRFSHSTMPVANLFKNCGYYWGFTAYVAYHVNHPLYTAPPCIQVALGLGLFALCEIGNFSVHLLLRNLRPAGTNVRKIPIPDSNPFNKLFKYVSCPNYTYEYGAWLGFTIMTSCVPALLFTLAGAYQMSVWALGKHRNYKKEFSTYPKERKAIFPFIL